MVLAKRGGSLPGPGGSKESCAAMIAPPPESSGELESALDRHGIKPRAVSLVSPLKELKGRRWAYRVEGDDGRVVKARQFEDDGAARRAVELLADVEDAFAPATASSL